MKHLSFVLAIAALGGLGPQVAWTQVTKLPKPVPQASFAKKAPPTQDSLKAIVIRGRLLWEYDFVSWASSDSIAARRPAAGLVDGYVALKLEAGTHTAVLDDIPEDTDVFHVLAREPSVPEYVLTDEFVYMISPDGAIRLVGRSREVLGDRAKP